MLRKVTPFEYFVAAVAILTIVFWRDPVPAALAGQPSYFILLHFLGLLASFVFGSRMLFHHHATFAAWQGLAFLAGGMVPIIVLMMVHMGNRGSLTMIAVGWLVCGLTAGLFALPTLEGRQHLRFPTRRQRALWIAPWVLGCVVAALITVKSQPTYDPKDSPYRAWFPREAG